MIEVLRVRSGMFDSNIFLVRGDSSSVLVDAGTGFSGRDVERSVRDSLYGTSLSGIVLTHEHFDHSGGALDLSRAFDVPVHASAECAKALKMADPLRTGAFLFGGAMEPLEEVKTLGEMLSLGGVEFKVHATPGHAPGMVCLIETKGRSLFCGDLLFCDGGVGRWDLPGGDLQLLKGSIKRSLEWDVGSLHPGHGRSEHSDPKSEMRLAYGMVKDL